MPLKNCTDVLMHTQAFVAAVSSSILQDKLAVAGLNLALSVCKVEFETWPCVVTLHEFKRSTNGRYISTAMSVLTELKVLGLRLIFQTLLAHTLVILNAFACLQACRKLQNAVPASLFDFSLRPFYVASVQ